ncbi:glucans biosynthesis glucosyltransferase MdoH [Dinoroseobacter sp. S76]|uniref:glucans biosynthesis glucosyltransferase MdoH n=1 Tax=Dinoroseobacter sp. S76 TaxID=3415124 RepID=UPI003C7D249E
MTPYAAAMMPPRAPLEMRPQSFGKVAAPPRGVAQGRGRQNWLWRAAAFLPTAIVATVICSYAADHLAQGGVSVIEAMALGVIVLSTVWLFFAVSSACLGMVRYAIQRDVKLAREDIPTQTIALLLPIYNETPWDVFGNASAMMRDLQRSQGDSFSLFILSDTQSPEIAALEERAFARLQAEFCGAAPVYYRRRRHNTSKKVGNITDWIENWGADYDAMLVLDADSLMSGQAIRELADALASDPDAGLIQSRPVLIGAETLFGRVQQFANTAYGWLIAEGVASWSQDEGNYWGHNAIIRTRAFAESSRLPHLRSLRGKDQLIMSHDFIEAAMLRRAGWRVRLLPRVAGSYEETPLTLIDYSLRDRRWCLGNMQHLRILAARGFHPISRLHLLQGALAFLMSPAWLAALVLWALVGVPESGAAPEYFSLAHPHQVIWPEATDQRLGWFFLLFVYGMLLFPKLIGAALYGMRTRTRVAYGSGLVYVSTICFELFLSVLYAPITMIQHTIATARALVGWSSGWTPQNRTNVSYGWMETLRFHWVETVLGLVLLAGVVAGQISALILLVAVSLAGAVPLSKLSGMRVANATSRTLRLDTPLSLREPAIVLSARAERAKFRATLTEQPTSIAAE